MGPRYEAELTHLISRLDRADTLSSTEADKLYRSAFEDAFPKLLEGQTYGEAMGGLSILNQTEGEFRSELKAIDNDLGRQIAIVEEALNTWFSKGEIPPPYYAWRIAVILSKAKRKDEESNFLSSWCKHFGHVRGTRYEALASRARKLGAF